MTSTLIQPSCVARRRATDPLRAGDALPAEAFAAIRRRLVLEHCKWDPQVEDVSTLTPFPLLMPHAVWADLCASAEALAAELLEAERELLDVMVELAQEGMTMMVVTHEMGFARKVAHRVIFMDQGEIVEDASKEEFFGSPRSERGSWL